jgi:hypothetical protein
MSMDNVSMRDDLDQPQLNIHYLEKIG